MSETQEFETILIDEQSAGKRLDSLLVSIYPTFSRTYFQYLIENGAVLINGKSVKKREKPKPGDEIELCFLLTKEISLEPEAIALDILYEDAHMLAINKKAGMVVHPAPGNPNGTFVNALLHHCKELECDKDSIRPGIVHRLDKETSGLLIAAKTVLAHQNLIKLFSSRQIEKKYLALVVGNPGNCKVDLPIGRHETKRKEMTVKKEGGKPAQSTVRVLKTKGNFSLIEVEIHTGRTHQIRVHMKALNTPVLGDSVYGSSSINEKIGAKRQMLHANTLKLPHPITGEQLSLTAPLPEDFLALKKKLLEE